MTDTPINSGDLAFVDTNILIYAVSPDERRHSEAFGLIDRLIATSALRVSTQVLQEFFSVSTGKMRHRLTAAQALAYMDTWAVTPVVLIDYPAIRDAAGLSESKQLSFWDALIVIAAKRCGAKRLYTEDLNHGQVIDGVEVVNPFR